MIKSHKASILCKTLQTHCWITVNQLFPSLACKAVNLLFYFLFFRRVGIWIIQFYLNYHILCLCLRRYSALFAPWKLMRSHLITNLYGKCSAVISIHLLNWKILKMCSLYYWCLNERTLQHRISIKACNSNLKYGVLWQSLFISLFIVL